VISRTTIFILSGVLMGSGLGKETWHAATAMNVLAGAAGLIAYFVLDHLARRREVRAAQRRLRRAQRTLARRIERHVRRLPAPLCGQGHRDRSTGQYVTVVSRKG
jgi:hypothetical protein